MLLLEEQKTVAKDHLMRFNTEQYFDMISKGIIVEGAPYELLDGLLVIKDRSANGEDPMSIGKLHNLLVQLLFRLNAELAAFDCYVQIQGPVVLGENQAPEPDGAIIKGSPEKYADGLPGPEDVLAIIEVSDSSLRTDRTTKARIYATAGIPQYVILDLINMQAELYEAPDKAAGTYAKKTTLRRDDDVTFILRKRKKLAVPVSKLMR